MWNKMKNKFYAVLGLSLLLFSCQKEEADTAMPSARSIYLRATVENSMLTRVPYILSAPERKNPLIAAVWASTTEYEFQNSDANGKNDENKVALHTEAKFTSGTEQLLSDAVYPNKNDTKVYFVGLHPVNGWTDQVGKTATGTFHGFEDAMFAPQISGSYAENVEQEKWPTFVFHHLLTWLRVKVKADGEAVSNAWGKLKSLKLKSRNTVTVDLSKAYDRSCVSFSGDKELDFYKTGTDEVFLNKDDESTWYVLPDNESKEVAYVLCAPVLATKQDSEEQDKVVRTAEYTLIIETESRTVEVPVDLMDEKSSYFEGDTMSHQFIISLNFKMGNNIAVSAAVTDWLTGGLGSEVLDPNN